MDRCWEIDLMNEAYDSICMPTMEVDSCTFHEHYEALGAWNVSVSVTMWRGKLIIFSGKSLGTRFSFKMTSLNI